MKGGGAKERGAGQGWGENKGGKKTQGGGKDDKKNPTGKREIEKRL